MIVHPARGLPVARRILSEEMEAFDAACSRFRPDSEISRLNRSAGRATRVGPLLVEALLRALRAAERTGGAVDPTVGGALLSLGYDRDFDKIAGDDATRPLGAPPSPAAGWRSVTLDAGERTVTVKPGTVLDLGATAKALCADRAAARIAAETGGGVLVDLGGDLATAGPPPIGGWQVAVVDSARSGGTADLDHCVVALWGGALASSGTTVRSWIRAGRLLHHIVDPMTGWPAEPVWREVTVGAGSCVEANTASTAAIVWGEQAPFRVAQMGLPARFVRTDGSVTEIGGWPVADVRTADVSSAAS